MMRQVLFFLVILLLAGVAGGSILTRPVAPGEWDDVTRTWAARSCVGEAGFGRYDECGAILWVIAKKRDEVNGTRGDHPVTFLEVLTRYSAALKPHQGHPNPWLFDLNPGMEAPPKAWPRLSWPRHRALWNSTLAYVEAWAQGKIPDQYPTANEYGGPMDRHRARAMGMRLIVTLRPGGNDLWRSRTR
jgi:hypothetical protein